MHTVTGMTAGFIEPYPAVIAPNPGGVDDPLGESVADPALPWVRVFEPRDTRIVIGRHQDPQREVVLDHARADGVPVHRRIAGGGTVVLASGMVVVAMRLAPQPLGSIDWFATINAALVPAVMAVAGVPVAVRGHGDLTVLGADGMPRKILGASLRQTSRATVYLGVFLVTNAVPLMERYLRSPSREPDYRGGRDHHQFCTHLDGLGVTTGGLIESITTHVHQHLAARAGT